MVHIFTKMYKVRYRDMPVCGKHAAKKGNFGMDICYYIFGFKLTSLFAIDLCQNSKIEESTLETHG